ncbi:MAG: DUF3667 domain-containing protein [Acidobacteriota bacterium]
MEPSPTEIPTSCLGCGAELLADAEFCHRCGQRIPRGRLTLGGLWRELPARVFNLERGLLHTFVDSWRRPGQTARDYVRGRRSPFVTPFTYFLVGTAMQLLAVFLNGDLLRQEVRQNIESEERVIELLAERLGDDPARRFSELYLGTIRQAYTYLFLTCMSVPFALFMRGFGRWLKPRYNLAETLVFSLYTTAQLILVTGLAALVTMRFGSTVHLAFMLTFYFGYTPFAARGFFEGRGRPVLFVWIALVAAMATFFLALIALFAFVLFSQQPP